jgi:hypothetical protein
MVAQGGESQPAHQHVRFTTPELGEDTEEEEEDASDEDERTSEGHAQMHGCEAAAGRLLASTHAAIHASATIQGALQNTCVGERRVIDMTPRGRTDCD